MIKIIYIKKKLIFIFFQNKINIFITFSKIKNVDFIIEKYLQIILKNKIIKYY